MICKPCARAVHDPAFAEYTPRCLGCGIRRMALMKREEREKQLDRIQHVHGWGARVEAVKLLELELARIRAARN